MYIEVWASSNSMAHRSVLKVTDKMTQVYNDSIFGGISWSQDESKICFVGEAPEPATYKNHWEPEKKEEDKKDDARVAAEEEKKDSAKKPKEEEKKEEFF